LLVEFQLSGPSHGRVRPTIDLEDVLAGVAWPSDAGNEQTWLAVTDWVK
jgi:hypothetical protein